MASPSANDDESAQPRTAEHRRYRDKREQHDGEILRRTEGDCEPSHDRGEKGKQQRPDSAGHPRTHCGGGQCLGGPAPLAIRLPSIAVTTEDDSPGVFSRIEVVDPPYIPP